VGIKPDFTTPAKKEPTMKNRAYAVILTALVALMAASGASAKAPSVRSNVRLAQHSNVRLAQHSLVKQGHTAAYRSIDRRAARGLF